MPLLVSTQSWGEGLSGVDTELIRLGAKVEQVSRSRCILSWVYVTADLDGVQPISSDAASTIH